MHVQNPLFESFPIFVASSIVSGKGFPKVSGRNIANVPATEATTPIITIIAKLLGMYPIRMEQIPPTRAAGKSQNTYRGGKLSYFFKACFLYLTYCRTGSYCCVPNYSRKKFCSVNIDNGKTSCSIEFSKEGQKGLKNGAFGTVIKEH